MRPGLQARLFGVSLAVIAALAWIGGWWLSELLGAVAADPASLSEARLRLVWAALAAAIPALLLATTTAGVTSWAISRDVRTLLDHARATAAGDRVTVLPSFSESSDLAGVVGSVQHLSSDLARTVEDLAVARDRFQAVLERMDEAVLALDPGGKLVVVNRAGLDLLGLIRAPQGATLLEVVRFPDLDALVEKARAGKTASVEFDLRSADRRITVLARAAPLSGGGCVALLRDVTEVRRLETIRRDFVANVSHELRTPVSIIRSSAEALQDGGIADPVYGPRFALAIHRQSERLGALLNDLLTLSRLEAGGYALEAEPVRLLPLALQVEDLLQPRLRARGHPVHITLSDPLWVLADAVALSQVLLNLVDNAAKYTPEGSTIVIRLGAARRGQLRVEVADDGPGIPPMHRSRLFERFYRIDPGRSRDMGGTGLGLSIVKHLVEAMGGEVGMAPNEPRGSVFWISLPLAPPHAETDGLESASASEPA